MENYPDPVANLETFGMYKIFCRFVDKSLQQSADSSAKIFAARYAARRILNMYFSQIFFSYAELFLNTLRLSYRVAVRG